MLKRLLASFGLSGFLAFAVIAYRPATVQAFTTSCSVSNYSYTYLYGDPPTLVGSRYDTDSWNWDMSLNDCTSTLSQVRVKQWGKEVCDAYGGEYVVLQWQWTYFNGTYHYGNLQQQYDCGDLP